MPAADDGRSPGWRPGAWVIALALCSVGVVLVGHPQRGGFGPIDGWSLAVAVAAVAAWWAEGKGRSGGALILVGALLLTGAHFVAWRHFPTLFFWGLSILTWFLAAVSLFAKRRRLACLVAFCFALLLVCCIVTETWLVAAPLFARGEFEEVTGELGEADRQMSSILLPNATVRHRKIDFDVTYHTGPDRSRTVPSRPKTGARWSLFGGSFAFGWGLEDADTIAGRLQRANPHVRVYNYSMRGHGTADAYIQLRRELESHPDTNLCIYFLIVDHFRRTACPDSLTAQPWGQAKPRFTIQSGQPVFLGPAAGTLPPVSRLNVNLLRRSRLYSAAYPRWRPSAEELQLVAALAHGMKDVCDAATDCRFVLVRLPLQADYYQSCIDWDPASLTRWTGELAKAGVPVLDCANRFAEQLRSTGETERDYYFADRHPNARYATLIAEWLDGYLARLPSSRPTVPTAEAAEHAEDGS